MWWRVLAALSLVLLSTVALGEPVRIEGVRMWPAPESTRLVFDVNAPVEHKLFALKDPERVVIDLSGTRLDGLPELDFADSYIKQIRHARRNGNDLRVVLDMKTPVRPKSFVLKPNAEYGHRLVIDLEAPGKGSSRPVRRADRPAGKPRELVIAIDAGHGGEDPGAIGPRGTREKDVVLAIAKRLAALVERERGMRPLMIRDGDYYVGLKERVLKARQQRADLFVSIHADAFHDRRAHGSSVYILSTGGASSEAASWLADRENSSDLIGGVRLDDKDDLIAAVLLDLSQNASLEASHLVASEMLGQLKGVNRLHRHKVEQAGFRVLKAPDIPSLLVETAFISNPSEERKLRDPSHQRALARAMLDGIRRYFSRHPPPGTLLAEGERHHVIARGDTLSELANRYQVDLESLRTANDLNSDVLYVGQEIRIP